jgi:hypothetical protein
MARPAPQQPHLAGIDPGPSARARQAAGDRAEARADALHARCERAGVAWVRRISTHLRIVSGGRVVPTKKGTVDCLGMLRGGQAVAVEIKSCSDGRLAFDRLPPHQRKELAAVEQFGGLALVLVIAPLEVYAVPWSVIARAIEAGACASLGPEALRPFRCDPREPYLAQWAAPANDSEAR